MSEATPPVKPDRWVAVVLIADRVCALDGCEAEIAAVQTILRKLEGGLWAYEGVWACAEHSSMLDEPQELMPTCRVGRPGGTSPCGAVTSHVAIAGVSDEERGVWLRAVSVCPRHARSLIGRVSRKFP